LALLESLSVANFSLCLKDFDFDNLPTDIGPIIDAPSAMALHRREQALAMESRRTATLERDVRARYAPLLCALCSSAFGVPFWCLFVHVAR
jgi:hypothetical protein